MATYKIDNKGAYYREHPQQVMYDFIKNVLDNLYDVITDLVDELPDITLDTTIHITLPSKVAFEIAVQINGIWTIPDFRLPPQTFENDIWEFSIMGFTFEIEVNFPIFKLLDLIMPQLSNPEITHADLLWNINGEFVQGSTIRKYYTLGDGLVDGTCIGALLLLCYGLTTFGAHKIQEALAQKSLSKNTFKPNISIKTLSDDMKTVKTTTSNTADDITDVKSDMSTVKTDTGTIKTDAATIKSDASAIKNLTTGTNLANKFVQTVAYLDDAKDALADLGLDTAAITTAVGVANTAITTSVLNKSDGENLTDQLTENKDAILKVDEVVKQIKEKVKYGAYT